MPEQIHGHEVMKMMIESKKVYTKDSLRTDIVKTFGENTSIYTCSAENMTQDELIALLNSRGKFLDRGDGFNSDLDKICDH